MEKREWDMNRENAKENMENRNLKKGNGEMGLVNGK